MTSSGGAGGRWAKQKNTKGDGAASYPYLFSYFACDKNNVPTKVFINQFYPKVEIPQFYSSVTEFPTWLNNVDPPPKEILEWISYLYSENSLCSKLLNMIVMEAMHWKRVYAPPKFVQNPNNQIEKSYMSKIADASIPYVERYKNVIKLQYGYMADIQFYFLNILEHYNSDTVGYLTSTLSKYLNFITSARNTIFKDVPTLKEPCLCDFEKYKRPTVDRVANKKPLPQRWPRLQMSIDNQENMIILQEIANLFTMDNFKQVISNDYVIWSGVLAAIAASYSGLSYLYKNRIEKIKIANPRRYRYVRALMKLYKRTPWGTEKVKYLKKLLRALIKPL